MDLQPTLQRDDRAASRESATWPTGAVYDHIAGGLRYAEPTGIDGVVHPVGQRDSDGRIFDGHGWVEWWRSTEQADDDDAWFSSGLDEQHQAHLDDLAHTEDDADVDEAGR